MLRSALRCWAVFRGSSKSCLCALPVDPTSLQPTLATPPLTPHTHRYGDLLAHWQLKAALRGEAPPLSAEALQGVMDTLGANTQRLAKLEREVESYWVAEYFRQATQ